MSNPAIPNSDLFPSAAGFVYAENTRNPPLNIERTRPTSPATIDDRGKSMVAGEVGITGVGLLTSCIKT